MHTAQASLVKGPVHTYPDIFETEIFSSVFKKKKKRAHTQRIRIVFARPHENAKTMEYDSVPYEAYALLVI